MNAEDIQPLVFGGEILDHSDHLFFELIQRLYRDKQRKLCDKSLAPIEFFTLMTITAITDVKTGKLTDGVAEEMKKICGNDYRLTGEGATVGELVKFSGASMSSVSRKVTELEKKGYVARFPSKKDRRVIFLRPTEKGMKICIEEREKQIALRDHILEGLGKEKYLELLMLANRAFDLRDDFFKTVL